jgi:hypothetical protein
VNVGWDDAKDLVNQQKHGLSFAKARILFDSDADYLVIFDADHSESEDRFMAIGAIERGIVVIAFTEPEEDTIRIISARWASKREQSLYRSFMDRNL